MAALTNGRETGATPGQPDPHAVRVSLAASTPNEAVAPITVGPAAGPLVMLEASIGTGLLGGFAGDPARSPEQPRPGFLVDGRPTGARLRRSDDEHVVLDTGSGAATLQVLLLPREAGRPIGPVRREVVVDGWRFEVEVESAARAALRERARRGSAEAGHSGPTEVHAIIPGVVVAVSIAPGDDVVAGQQLLAVEAMKMQNELRAPRDGTIERVAVGVGQTIEVGDLLLVIN
jgi:biotin carboxyl carrier protein